jgi:serine protease Do
MARRLQTKVKVGELEKAEDEGLVEDQQDSQDAPAPQGLDIPLVGMSVKALNEGMRRDYAVPDNVEGVVIVSVDPVSEAAEKGLFEGDVIVEINQQPVAQPEKLKSVIDDAAAAGKPSVLLLVNREGDVRFLALKLDTKKKAEKKKVERAPVETKAPIAPAPAPAPETAPAPEAPVTP